MFAENLYDNYLTVDKKKYRSTSGINFKLVVLTINPKRFLEYIVLTKIDYIY